ncbi:MAG: hypothetical protein ACFCBV_13485 [Phycisphaerales bacterium]
MSKSTEDTGAFELPDDLPGDQFEDDAFEEPDLDDDSADFDSEAESNAGAETEADEDTATPAIRQALDQITMRLQQNGGTGVQSLEDIAGPGNVVGAGAIAEPLGDELVPPGEAALGVFTVEQADEESLRRSLFDDMSVRAASDDSFPVVPITTGVIDAEAHRFRIRPAPGGVSVGHPRITAGTLGCLVRDRRRLYILSNNHVLANSNNAKVGDMLLQPGPADGGRDPRDRIAMLQKWVKIDFTGKKNYVDCALGWTSPRLVRRELVYIYRGRRRFFRVSRRPANPVVGKLVGKSGRTTQLTAGRVISTNATLRVNFGGGRVGVFTDQMAVRGNGSRPFSAGGDSGSLIWNWDRQRQPVGLLFAGGGGITFGNKINRVLRALNVQLYT